MFRVLKSSFAAAALAVMAMSSAAAACAKPEYPSQASYLGEEGISLVGFLVRTDGSVAKSIVVNSSGSRSLDQETAHALSRCKFKPATQDGQPVESWQIVAYTWALGDYGYLERAQQAAEVAVAKGDLQARYHLSMLLRKTARTDADRERADTLLRSAADRGLAHAQFEIGRRLETGYGGAPKDVDAAMPWYHKAAEQGDVFALQRLEKDVLL